MTSSDSQNTSTERDMKLYASNGQTGTAPPPLKKRRGRPSLYLSVWRNPITQAAISAVSSDPPVSSQRGLEVTNSGKVAAITPLPLGVEKASPPNSPKPKRQKRAKSATDTEDMALRKFYEAGGRDYKQFLQWKTENAEAFSGNLKPTPSVSSGPPVAVVVPATAPVVQATLPVQSAVESGTLNSNSLVLPDQVGLQHPFHPPATAPLTNPVPPYSFPLTGNPLWQYLNLHQSLVPHAHYSSLFPLTRPEKPVDLSVGKYEDHQMTEPKAKRRMNSADSSSECDTSATFHSPTTVNPNDFPLNEPEVHQTRTSSPHIDIVNSTSATEWSVDQVAEFVSRIPGCQEYADVFREQGIDGTTLLHLSEEHLLQHIRMKLGPAIRLRLEVDKLSAQTE